MKSERRNGEGRSSNRRNGRGAAYKGRRRASSAGDDEYIVRSLKNGDQEALKIIIERHHDRLFYHVDGICRNSADAEEVLQDTYVTTWTRIGDFKGKSSLSTWMYRIAANMALMKRRKEERWRKNTTLLEESLAFPGTHGVSLSAVPLPESPEDRMLAGELGDEIHRAWDGLAEMYKAVFTLRDIHGLTIKETCEALDLTVSAGKSRLRRSRLALQKRLSRYVEAGPETCAGPSGLTMEDRS